MGLEAVTHISDLVITNPVGATDPKSQGDDHIRNIKKALKTDFPNITGPVTSTQAELNILDGVTLTAAQINDAARLSVANTFTLSQTISNNVARLFLDDPGAGAGLRKFFIESDGAHFSISTADDGGSGVATAVDIAKNASSVVTSIALTATAITLNGVNVTDFARLSQVNTFAARNDFTASSTGNDFSIDIRAAAPGLLYVATGQAADTKNWRQWVSGTSWQIQTETDAGGAGSDVIVATRSGTTVSTLALSATAITLNGVAASDFARKSQANTFTATPQTISAANAAYVATDTGGTITTNFASGGGTGGGYAGTATNHSFDLFTNGTSRYSISNGGNHDFKSGTAVFGGAATANSSLTAAAAFMTSNAITPPGLSASQNDYAPTGHATASIFRLDPNGNTPAAITGLAGGVNGRRVMFIRLNGTTGTIQFTKESASSAAANRFQDCAAGSYTLTTGFLAIEFVYDGTAQRWVPLGGFT